MELEPYLFFTGNCEEALNFYRGIFGGEISEISRMKDAPMETPPGYGDKIMHASFKSPALKFMASDTRPGKTYGEGPISLSLSTKDQNEAKRIFDALSQGANVEMPMEKTFWGALFGMLTDKFGIDWMVNCQLEQ